MVFIIRLSLGYNLKYSMTCAHTAPDRLRHRPIEHSVRRNSTNVTYNKATIPLIRIAPNEWWRAVVKSGGSLISSSISNKEQGEGN